MLSGHAIVGNRWDALAGLWPNEPPLVSVIVVHYEQQSELDRTLLALSLQDYPSDRLEIIVVDDGSHQAPTVPDGIVLVRQKDLGFRASAARNLGVTHSSGEILCFLDADTSPEPDYIRQITRLPALSQDVVAVGHRRHADFSRSPQPGVAHADAVALPSPQWLVDAYNQSNDLLIADNRSYRFIISAVLTCSRALFDEVGGFDESFDDYGGEDWEWAHRAWLAGAVFAHVPDAVAWHDGPDWAGREADDPQRVATKNQETLILSHLIPVAGSRGHAIRGPVADVVVVLQSAPSIAAAFVCIDSILEALPHATCVVPPEAMGPLGSDSRVLSSDSPAAADLIQKARVIVEVPHPVRVTQPPALQEGASEGLRSAIDRVGTNAVGSIVFITENGRVLVSAQRAARRAARWGRDDLFTQEEIAADWFTVLDTEPRLAPYLGGWG
ncbi:MAG TPA: glycosyltransferase [Glaciihabitans sp.]|jgi:hypothetical protein|nr:glycosyltransferase [Glaciihabitans sp.]